MDFFDYYPFGFRPYVSAAARRANAVQELAKLKKTGRSPSPVVIEGRKIARTFWGKAWCDNLERYGDYANRLPRGRSYVRNGSVVDLQVAPGRVTALVSGSRLYEVNVTITPVPPKHWRAICQDCSGAIDSLVELLQGRFSTAVMTRLCESKTGLFPAPKEITFDCSCPDWASMCKHVAAVLYGIGARLDERPELLFPLRKVDHHALITNAGTGLSNGLKRPAADKVLGNDDLAEVFGIEMAPIDPPNRARRAARPKSRPPGQSKESGKRNQVAIVPMTSPRSTSRQSKGIDVQDRRRRDARRMKKRWEVAKAARKSRAPR